MSVHFRPTNGYVGDLIPFERDGRLWLFYLLDERLEPPTGMPWALVSTDDFVSYTDHGVVLPSGGPQAEDFDCYTGCVIDDGDQFHLYYTGHNPARTTPDGDLQVVCHATSDGSLTQWQRHPDHTFGAPAGYLPQDWRDPYVYRVTPNDPWVMVLAARHTRGSRPTQRRRRQLTSTDLITWHPTTPLWDPHRFTTQECPEVFQWGDWWYLVYSEFTEAFQTRYRIASGPNGPWLAPVRLHRRTRPLRVQVRRTRRTPVLCGMDCDPRRQSRRRRLGMGRRARSPRGNPATRRHAGLRPPSRAHPSFTHSEAIQLEAVNGASGTPGDGAPDGYAAWVGPTLPDSCLITVTIEIPPGNGSCGLLLRTDSEAEYGYEVRLEPARSRVVFDRWPRGRTGPAQWQARGDVPMRSNSNARALPAGQHTIQVLIDGSTIVAVIDDLVALSAGSMTIARDGRPLHM